jgi:hypothetical protein
MITAMRGFVVKAGLLLKLVSYRHQLTYRSWEL